MRSNVRNAKINPARPESTVTVLVKKTPTNFIASPAPPALPAKSAADVARRNPALANHAH